ncbi:MAG: STAS domain-containing protein [Rhodospirillales bacterium]|nr:STAS domain-containing protein [Rhodospirillales bacterium]
MKMETRKEAGLRVVSLAGDVDLQHSPTLRKELLVVVAEGLPVIVDLGGVSYIDSSGVASLVEAFQAARKKQIPFSLAGLSASVQRVMQLARLDRVFTIHANLDEALKRNQ